MAPLSHLCTCCAPSHFPLGCCRALQKCSPTLLCFPAGWGPRWVFPLLAPEHQTFMGHLGQLGLAGVLGSCFLPAKGYFAWLPPPAPSFLSSPLFPPDVHRAGFGAFCQKSIFSLKFSSGGLAWFWRAPFPTGWMLTIPHPKHLSAVPMDRSVQGSPSPGVCCEME